MKASITTLFLFLKLASFGQEAASKQVYKILSEGNISNAPYREVAKEKLKSYASKHSKSTAGLLAKFYLAEIFYQQDELDSANPLYQEVITLFGSNDADIINNQHFSAVRLAEIAITHHDFCSSFNYLYLAKQSFPLKSFCGNAYWDDERRLKVLYSVCYIGQGEYIRAIDSLSKNMFDIGFPNDTTLENTLYKAYLKIYTKEEIRNEFIQSLSEKVSIRKEKSYAYLFFQPTIRIFNKEINFWDYKYDLNRLNDEEKINKCRQTISESKMFKLVTQ